jgi:glutamine synthetase
LSPEEKTDLNVVGKIPDVLLDNTDRNRTSPLLLQEINLSLEL